MKPTSPVSRRNSTTPLALSLFLLSPGGTRQRPSRYLSTRGGVVPQMGRSEDYRHFSQECLEMARTAEDARVRATLLQMAQIWFRLVQEAEASNNSQQD